MTPFFIVNPPFGKILADPSLPTLLVPGMTISPGIRAHTNASSPPRFNHYSFSLHVPGRKERNVRIPLTLWFLQSSLVWLFLAIKKPTLRFAKRAGHPLNIRFIFSLGLFQRHIRISPNIPILADLKILSKDFSLWK
jgi:hypothetical protein